VVVEQYPGEIRVTCSRDEEVGGLHLTRRPGQADLDENQLAVAHPVEK
jgi:hypothetical protein